VILFVASNGEEIYLKKEKLMNAMYRVVAIGILVAVSAHHAFATPLIGNPTGSLVNSAGAGATYSQGYRFVVGADDLSVDALGMWDHDADGLLVDHQVAIYTDTGTQLAVATVPAGTSGTLVGQYRYTSIAPIILDSGIAYRIAAFFNTGEDYMNNGATFSVDSAASSYASFSSWYGGPAGSVAFPGGPGASTGGYIGPNLNFSVVSVPEPNSMILTCLASAGVLRLVRRRRS